MTKEKISRKDFIVKSLAIISGIGFLLMFAKKTVAEFVISSNTDTNEMIKIVGATSATFIGITKQTVAYDSGTVTIDPRFGGNAHLTFGAGNITTLNILPPPAGNPKMMLKLKQDGTGGRTVTNWVNTAFVSGAVPVLSTGANDIDLLAFYWDDDESKWEGLIANDFS